MSTEYSLRVIGAVASPITRVEDAPRQGDEFDVECWIHVTDDVRAAATDLAVGDRLVVLTWLHGANRDVLAVHPRGDASRPLTGVFSTRSPHRPNPIGLHEVEVVAIDAGRLRVRGLEAIDGTPVLDIKPVLAPKGQR